MPLDPSDRFEINDLYSRYSHCIDSGDAEGWADVFIPEGRFEMVDLEGNEVFVVSGRDGLVKMARDENETRTKGRGRHWHNNILVEGEAPVARARTYGFLIQDVDGAMKILAHGNFEDELVKGPEGWRFSRRRCFVIGAGALEE